MQPVQAPLNALSLTVPEHVLPAAVQQNNLVLVGDLLRLGANVNQKDALGYTPLMLAAGSGYVQMVEMLLAADADLCILDTRMGASALHKAAQSGVVDVARLLLEHGAFLNLQSPHLGHTPLIDAVWHKKTAMVQYLLEQGAKPNLCTHSGVTALDMAIRDHLTDIIHLLELHNQRLTEQVQAQPLMTAVRENDISAVRRLIAEGADVDQKSPMLGGPDDGHTPLLVAARDGHTAIVQVLLDAGANPRLVDGLIKATPGHKAGYMGHTEVARLLVDHGLEIDAQGPYNGYTALHDAIWHGHAETANIFLEAGAHVDLRGHDGLTPLQMAHAYGYYDIVTLLEAKQAE